MRFRLFPDVFGWCASRCAICDWSSLANDDGGTDDSRSFGFVTYCSPPWIVGLLIGALRIMKTTCLTAISQSCFSAAAAIFAATAIFACALLFGLIEASPMLFAEPPSASELIGVLVFSWIALGVLKMVWVTHQRIERALNPKNIAAEVSAAIRAKIWRSSTGQ